MKKNTGFSERLKKVIDYLNITPNDFGKKLGYDRSQTVYDALNGRCKPSFDFIFRIINTEYSAIINTDWLVSGSGNMLRNQNVHDSSHAHTNNDTQTAQNQRKDTKNIVPLYNDVDSFGGNNEYSANMDGSLSPTEYIDTGDWFRGITAAIRHYGDSMVEYPPGCILALREIQERHLIVDGEDYVIETSEYRITKCVERGSDKSHIIAYSSNKETHNDGSLKHKPIPIAWADIRKIFLVLGYVVKKNGGTMVYSGKK
ncbi:MAG: hypothetical protein FWC34_09200 [Bacteroidetes bacterium]|nr:hypothetical protein [Bacteroidota bacterium]MCL2303025.1 hypothetical protein [Lentimicrobiaceae bacterium]